MSAVERGHEQYVDYWTTQPMLTYMMGMLYMDTRRDGITADVDLAHVWAGYYQVYGPGF